MSGIVKRVATCALCGEPVAILITDKMAFVCQNPGCEKYQPPIAAKCPESTSGGQYGSFGRTEIEKPPISERPSIPASSD